MTEGVSKLIVLFFVCLCAPAFAQRGGHMPDLPQDAAPQNNLTGFPGFFDTNTIPSGRFIAELPTFTVDYGLTPRLSLGVNALSALTALGSNPLLYLKSRFRIFSGGQMASVITGYGAFAYFPSKEDATKSLSAIGGLLTQNNTYYIREDLHAHLSFITGQANMSQGKSGDISYSNLHATIFMASGGVTYFLSNFMDFQGILLWNAYNSIESDNSAESSTLSLKSKTPVLARLATEFTLKEKWLFSAYLWVADSAAVPWLGVSYKW